MQNVKCLKCGWKGSSVKTLKQWFGVKAMTDNEVQTQELLMICPECEVGVCVEDKRKRAK